MNPRRQQRNRLPHTGKRLVVTEFLGPRAKSDGSPSANGAAFTETERLFDMLIEFFDVDGSTLGIKH